MTIGRAILSFLFLSSFRSFRSLSVLSTFDQPRILYPVAIITILTWWAMAFFPLQSTVSVDLVPPSKWLATTSQEPAHLHVRPLDRKQIHQALQGDFALITALISEWDVDAQWLAANGVTGIKRLSTDQLLRAHQLSRRIAAAQQRSVDAPFSSPYCSEMDDLGIRLQLNKPPQRFLPQTELAASVLLTVCPTEQIVAIPRRLRQQSLFTADKMSAIPLDIDRFNTEKLYAARPDVAFVAHYTQPTIIQTLREQGVALFTTTRIDSVAEVQEALQKIGAAAGQYEKAELLTLFMEAGFIAVDNHLRANHVDDTACVLYLNHDLNFSAPGCQRLSAHLAERLGINRCLERGQGRETKTPWQIALSSEQIARLNPDCIIISTDNGPELVASILNNPIFKSTSAVKQGHVYAVEESIQSSPTQFLLLAYLDLSTILYQNKLKICLSIARDHRR